MDFPPSPLDDSHAHGAAIAGLAHDLKNLLTAMIASIDLALISDSIPAGLTKSLGATRQTGRRAADLAGCLLSVVRKPKIPTQAVDVEGIVRRVLDAIPQGSGIHCKFRVLDESGQLWPAASEEWKFYLALLNLIRDRIGVMGENGSLVIEARNIPAQDASLSGLALPTREYVAVDLFDGVPWSEADFEFDLSRRERSNTLIKGTCLALILVQASVADAGGGIAVQREHGGLARVRILIPRFSPPAIPPERKADVAAPGTVLVLEDDPAVQVLLKSILGYRGFCVFAGDGPDEACARLREDGPSISLVVMDAGWLARPDVGPLRRWMENAPTLNVILLGEIDPSLQLNRPTAVCPKPIDRECFLQAVSAVRG